MKISLFLIIIFFLYSCTIPENTEIKTDNRYSNKFSVTEHEGFAILTIFNPWQQSRGVEINYVLSDEPTNIPDSLKDLTFIQTPVSEVIVFSTTHIGFINAIGETSSIKGVSGLKYSCNPWIKSASEKGTVYEVGTPPNINYEKIIEINPDLIFLYGLETSVSGIRSRLENAGIPVILIAEYLEPHPLGKLEWIKLFGWLYGKKEISSSIFKEAYKSYEYYRGKVAEIEDKPSVLIGLPWKETWYMAGGKSFSARFIEDAGGNYLWKDNLSREYIPLSLEAALSRAFEADVWLNVGTAKNITEILGRDNRFRNLKVLDCGEVYNNNLRVCKSGGNAFWEDGVVEPHLILKDMIKILHPEILQSHDFVYYRKLE